MKLIFKETYFIIKENFDRVFGLIVVICFSFFLIGMFSFLTLKFYRFVRTSKKELSIEIFLKENVDKNDLRRLGNYLRNLPGVDKIKYISKEEAKRIFIKNFEDYMDVFKFLNENPLPSSFVIYPKVNYVNKEDINFLIEEIKIMPWVDEVVVSNEFILRVSGFFDFILLGFVFFFFMILWVNSFVIFYTIKVSLDNRKRVLEVMDLIGVPEHVKRAPFVLNGTLYGFLGSFLACLLIYLVLNFLKLSFNFNDLFLIFIFLVVVGVLVGWGSALKVLSEIK